MIGLPKPGVHPIFFRCRSFDRVELPGRADNEVPQGFLLLLNDLLVMHRFFPLRADRLLVILPGQIPADDGEHEPNRCADLPGQWQRGKHGYSFTGGD